MKRIICFLMVWLSIGSSVGLGLCDPSPVGPVSAVKSGENPLSTVPMNSSEKPGDVANKHSVASEHMMEKLSNALSNEYIIGAEDVLEITVWKNVDLSKTIQVRPDGKISMPIIRDIMAEGKTPSQLAEEVTNKLKEYVQIPVVAVGVKEVNSSNIFVLGEVKSPGRYPLKSKTTLLQGITIAGGFTPIAARNQMVIFRFTEGIPSKAKRHCCRELLLLV